MFKPTDFALTSFQISGTPNGAGLLLEVAELKEYVNNQTTDKVIGQKFTVVFPANKFEKLVVKVLETTNIITNEQIQAEGGQIAIILDNLTGKFYRTDKGEYAISCSATGWKRQPNK